MAATLNKKGKITMTGQVFVVRNHQKHRQRKNDPFRKQLGECGNYFLFLKKPLFDLMSLENSDVINKNFNHWL